MNTILVQWKVLLVAFVIGGLLAFGLVSLSSNKQIEKLKQYGDSVAVVAKQRDSAANRFSDSVRIVVGELEKTKRALTNVAATNRRKDTQLDSVLAIASTTADSNNIRGQQIENLRQEVVTLNGALAIANNQLATETARGDSVLRTLNAANRDIVNLNNRIQHLGPTVPKWVRPAAEVVAVAAAFYAGTKVK